MGPATGSPSPILYQPSFSSTREAAILTAQVSTNVLVAAAAAAAVRTQQVAEFATDAGSEAHASSITASAMKEEAAQAAQAAARAALATAKVAIAEVDATTFTT